MQVRRCCNVLNKPLSPLTHICQKVDSPKAESGPRSLGRVNAFRAGSYHLTSCRQRRGGGGGISRSEACADSSYQWLVDKLHSDRNLTWCHLQQNIKFVSLLFQTGQQLIARGETKPKQSVKGETKRNGAGQVKHSKCSSKPVSPNYLDYGSYFHSLSAKCLQAGWTNTSRSVSSLLGRMPPSSLRVTL